MCFLPTQANEFIDTYNSNMKRSKTIQNGPPSKLSCASFGTLVLFLGQMTIYHPRFDEMLYPTI